MLRFGGEQGHRHPAIQLRFARFRTLITPRIRPQPSQLKTKRRESFPTAASELFGSWPLLPTAPRFFCMTWHEDCFIRFCFTSFFFPPPLGPRVCQTSPCPFSRKWLPFYTALRVSVEPLGENSARRRICTLGFCDTACVRAHRKPGRKTGIQTATRTPIPRVC